MSPAPLIDIGINLTHDAFDHDRKEVIAAAAAVGVGRLVITGTSVESSSAAATLTTEDPARLFATAGVHPHHAAELTEPQLSTLRALLKQPGVVAVGECGLDYHRDYSPRDAQRRAFEWQLALAIETGRPLFLHNRDAQADFVAILRAAGRACPRAVAHCFTGTLAEAEELLALGLHLGITGWICDERRGRHLLEVVRHIPAERLMLETDGPYLLPRTLRPPPPGRRNEPRFLPEVCRVVADARGEAYEVTARASTRTAETFFGLVACP
jgi:TatD DNase family protein